MPGKWRRTVRKSKNRVAIAPVSSERPEKADELIPLIGETICLTWGVGSQQTKHAAQGFLRGVTPRFATLEVAGRDVLIPLNWIIRYTQ